MELSLSLFLSRGLVAVIFLTSSLAKLRQPQTFVVAVTRYEVLPTGWVRPFAFTLPWLELAISVMLLLGWGTRMAATFSATLLFIFLVAMSITLIRIRQYSTMERVGCSCSGNSRSPKLVGKQSLAISS